MSFWWLALAVLVLPIWWHRDKRERADSQALATARFLPRADPRQQRVWRWVDRMLLLVRLLLLAAVVGWLADMVLPWRGDSVLVAPGTDQAWATQQVNNAGFAKARRIELTQTDAFAWLARHEREWKSDARILVLGDVPMPAAMPRLKHQVTVLLQPKPQALPVTEHRVTIVSPRADRWWALFAALGGPQRYIVESAPSSKTELIIWDTPDAPPAALRAPLWWIGDPSAFPELTNAASIDGVRYADSARGRLWMSDAWPAGDAATARRQFEAWQRLHYAPVSYITPAQKFPAAASAAMAPASGALHDLLTIALVALFALERILAHARRR